jgi:hypothetical protein
VNSAVTAPQSVCVSGIPDNKQDWSQKKAGVAVHKPFPCLACTMGNTWSLAHGRSVSCAQGYGMCVALKHGLVIVSGGCRCQQLYMHSLPDGSLVRRVGSTGSGKGQFDFGFGGLCVSPDGDSLLVAESHNNRVQQVRIADGSWVRFVGEGVLKAPQCVDCNADIIVVSEVYCHHISVLSWADGSLRARFGSYGSGPGQVQFPCGVRLLADGSGLVVADSWTRRLCVFTLSGNFVSAVGNKMRSPYDVLECASDRSFIVANDKDHNITKLNRDNSDFEVYGKKGRGDGEFLCPTALAALPDGGLIVRDWFERFHVFRGFELRKTWVTVCVTLATHGWCDDRAAKRVRVGDT